jgi:hypothetical protein
MVILKEKNAFFGINEKNEKIELEENNSLVMRFRASLLKKELEEESNRQKEDSKKMKIGRELLKQLKKDLKELEPTPERKETRLTRLTRFYFNLNNYRNETNETLIAKFIAANSEENIKETAYSVTKLFEVLKGLDTENIILTFPVFPIETIETIETKKK